MEMTHPELDLLRLKLRRAELDHDFARSRGDSELISQSKLRISAIKAEHDRLVQRLTQPAAAFRDATSTFDAARARPTR